MVTRCGVWHRYDKVGISFLFGLTAIAVMPSVFSVPAMNFCVFCSVLKMMMLFPDG